MKIMKLTTTVLSNVKTSIYKKNGTDKLFFNVRHGTMGKNLHTYVLSLDAWKFKPKTSSDEITLDGDNYILNPIYKGTKAIKDNKDNQLYCISTDDMEDHKKDYLILWEIPNKFYTNVEYKTEGNVEVLAVGKMGKIRGGVEYISPAPILEVYGPCKLEWSAIKEGINYKQKFSFDGERWSVGQVSIINKDNSNGN